MRVEFIWRGVTWSVLVDAVYRTVRDPSDGCTYVSQSLGEITVDTARWSDDGRAVSQECIETFADDPRFRVAVLRELPRVEGAQTD